MDRDGAWNLRLRGPAADGVRFEEALRPFTEQAFRTGRTDGVRDTFDNRGYDAVLALCGIRPPTDDPPTPSPSAGKGAAGSGQAEPAPAPKAPMPTAPGKRPGGSNVKVIVRIDHTALVRGRTIAGETCEVASAPVRIWKPGTSYSYIWNLGW